MKKKDSHTHTHTHRFFFSFSRFSYIFCLSSYSLLFILVFFFFFFFCSFSFSFFLYFCIFFSINTHTHTHSLSLSHPHTHAHTRTLSLSVSPFLFRMVFFPSSPNKLFFRASWTSAFSLNLTRYICVGSFTSTTELLWMQLATPFLYFGFWLLLATLAWLWRRLFHSRTLNRSGSGRATLATYSNDNDNFEGSDEESRLLHDQAHGDNILTSDNYRDSNSSSSSNNNNNSHNNHSNHSNNHNHSISDLYRQYRFLRSFQLILLFSYETLTDQALQLLNCVRVGECGRVLAEYPDVHCDSGSENNAYRVLRIVAIILLVYAGVFPLLLLSKLFRIHRAFKHLPLDRELDDPLLVSSTNRHRLNLSAVLPSSSSNNNTHHHSHAEAECEAKYGIFYDHYKPRFYWWEVQVRAVT